MNDFNPYQGMVIEEDLPVHTACGMATDECICGQHTYFDCPNCKDESKVFPLPERKQPYIEPYFVEYMCYNCGWRYTEDTRDGR